MLVTSTCAHGGCWCRSEADRARGGARVIEIWSFKLVLPDFVVINVQSFTEKTGTCDWSVTTEGNGDICYKPGLSDGHKKHWSRTRRVELNSLELISVPLSVTIVSVAAGNSQRLLMFHRTRSMQDRGQCPIYLQKDHRHGQTASSPYET